jgi:hypothetical protein
MMNHESMWKEAPWSVSMYYMLCKVIRLHFLFRDDSFLHVQELADYSHSAKRKCVCVCVHACARLCSVECDVKHIEYGWLEGADVLCVMICQGVHLV